MSIGIWQIAIVVILVVLLFGRGKISSLMGDVAKELKVLKKGWLQKLLKTLNQKIFPKIIKILIIIIKILTIKNNSNATNWLV